MEGAIIVGPLFVGKEVKEAAAGEEVEEEVGELVGNLVELEVGGLLCDLGGDVVGKIVDNSVEYEIGSFSVG